EVKSKSCDPSEFEDEIWNSREKKKGALVLKANWVPYIYDVAFQSYVLKKSNPNFSVNSFLMLMDKSKYSSVDGLNQRFFLKKEKGRTRVIKKGDVSLSALGEHLLCKLSVNEAVTAIH